MLMLKWKLKAIKNIKTPPEAIIWMLALKFNIANIKQAKEDSSTPTKKKYNSINSVGGKTLTIINIEIILFRIKGIIRCLTLSKYIESTFFKVFNREKSRTGSSTVSIVTENNFAFIIGSGICLGALLK